ncbi:MAG: 6-phosphogluconolactonase [Aliidongia sp.]
MTRARDATLEILPDPDALARRVADWLLAVVTQAEGNFAIALSGGLTPHRLYRQLATAPYKLAFPWSRTHWFWGDERYVPHDSANSNCRGVREALLDLVPIPMGNIHPIPTHMPEPAKAAAAYEATLHAFYGATELDPARPLFDVVLLGLGTDGHTASLFPGSTALLERNRWVVPVIGMKPETRITLTYPALESTRQAAFLVEGEQKRAILARLRRGDTTVPAARLQPSGLLSIFTDTAAITPSVADPTIKTGIAVGSGDQQRR